MSDLNSGTTVWLDRIDDGARAWEAVVDRLGRDPDTTIMHIWSFRDITGHLNGWREWTARRMEAAVTGTVPSPPWPDGMGEETDEGTNEINAWFDAQARDRASAEVFAESRSQFARIRAATAQLPAGAIEQSPEWLDGYPLSAVIEGMLEHLREHVDELRPLLDEIDAKDRVRAQYGSVGDAYVKSTGHATGNDLQRMIEVGAPKPSDRLLDIATGGGHVARTFAPHVGSVVASDLTPEILHHARVAFDEQGLNAIETRVADAEELPFADDSFEIVTCRIAPHHFPHPERFVAEVTRVLTSGGRFILIDSTVPDGEAGRFVNRLEKLRDPSHVRALTIDEWSALISDAGLNLTIVESFPKRHDFEDWTSRSRMSQQDRDELELLFLTAPEETRQALGVEEADGKLVAFSDTKTLFVGVKAGLY